MLPSKIILARTACLGSFDSRCGGLRWGRIIRSLWSHASYCSANSNNQFRLRKRVRQTPQHVLLDIGDKFNLHLTISSLSKYSVTQVTKSTYFKTLLPQLKHMFMMYRILKSVTVDNSPPIQLQGLV